jgi:hypothetical protein
MFRNNRYNRVTKKHPKKFKPSDQKKNPKKFKPSDPPKTSKEIQTK